MKVYACVYVCINVCVYMYVCVCVNGLMDVYTVCLRHEIYQIKTR